MPAVNDLKFSAYTDVTDPRRAPDQLPAWQRLLSLANELKQVSTRDLFAADPTRTSDFCVQDQHLVLDLSRQRMDRRVLAALLDWAQENQLDQGRDMLFGGSQLNFTEARAAWHTGVRNPASLPAALAGEVNETMARARVLAQALRSGALRGTHGEPFRRVVNIGIGGSDLGPRLVTEALTGTTHEEVFDVRFVAGPDPAEMAAALEGADAASTFFILSSKSFGTAETLANAHCARQWLRDQLGDDCDLTLHFAATSNATQAAQAFGVAPERIFSVPEWVGGRFSLWSAIGLPIMIALGPHNFERLLDGARAMDHHFQSAPFATNLPALLALTGIWNSSLLGIQTLAALPYSYHLRTFPAWLQQLEMESNGKQCRYDGQTVTAPTSPIIWGGVEPNGQHAFHQLFYQGTHTLSLDFIVPVGPADPWHDALVHNAIAQAAALMEGRSLEQARHSLQQQGLAEAQIEALAPHLVCNGNHPSTMLMMPEVTAFTLGQLLALYEHKIFVQGWLWGINSFDQFGVELGKKMALKIAGADASEQDAATRAQLERVAQMRAHFYRHED